MLKEEWGKIKKGDKIKLIEPLDNEDLADSFKVGVTYNVESISHNSLGGRLVCVRGQSGWGFPENNCNKFKIIK